MLIMDDHSMSWSTLDTQAGPQHTVLMSHLATGCNWVKIQWQIRFSAHQHSWDLWMFIPPNKYDDIIWHYLISCKIDQNGRLSNYTFLSVSLTTQHNPAISSSWWLVFFFSLGAEFVFHSQASYDQSIEWRHGKGIIPGLGFIDWSKFTLW